MVDVEVMVVGEGGSGCVVMDALLSGAGPAGGGHQGGQGVEEDGVGPHDPFAAQDVEQFVPNVHQSPSSFSIGCIGNDYYIIGDILQ